jgi:dienelactone hydrolase
VNIPLEYFYGATDWLRERFGVPRIGLVGGSRGGEGVLLMAALNPEPFAAVVAGVPSNVPWPGCCSAEAFAAPAWTFQGQPVAGLGYAHDGSESFVFEPAPGEEVDYARLTLDVMLNPGAAAIPVERIRGPVLPLSGDSDQLWPSAVAGEQVQRRLTEHGFPFAVHHFAYPGARHAATSQMLVTSFANRVFHPVLQEVIQLGGTPALNAAAMRDAFNRTVAFFREHLPTGSPP